MTRHYEETPSNEQEQWEERRLDDSYTARFPHEGWQHQQGWLWQTPAGWNNNGKGEEIGQDEGDQQWTRWQQSAQQQPYITYGKELMQTQTYTNVQYVMSRLWKKKASTATIAKGNKCMLTDKSR